MADILFTEPAEYDLLDVEYYIHIHLCNPQAADRIVDGIIDTIRRLETFPEEHPLVNDELLSGVGLRMTRFDNYNIFYYYDGLEDVVHIIRILYNRADWKNILQW